MFSAFLAPLNPLIC